MARISPRIDAHRARAVFAAGFQVTLTVVYLSRATVWEEQLPAEVKRDVQVGAGRALAGAAI